MKIYISGGITNVPNFMEQFEITEKYLRKTYTTAEIINPALVNSHLPKSTSHEQYMKMSFVMLDMADVVYMMPNWKESYGANQEYGYALAKGKIIVFGKELNEPG